MHKRYFFDEILGAALQIFLKKKKLPRLDWAITPPTSVSFHVDPNQESDFYELFNLLSETSFAPIEGWLFCKCLTHLYCHVCCLLLEKFDQINASRAQS